MKIAMPVMRLIESAVDSINSASSLIISMAGETGIFEKLHSPYTSHQSVTLGEGHGEHEVIVFSNFNGSLLIVTKRFPEEIKKVLSLENFSWGIIPSYLLRWNFRFPINIPLWFDGLLNAAIPNQFSGYDESGEPQFERKVSCLIRGEQFPDWIERMLS